MNFGSYTALDYSSSEQMSSLQQFYFFTWNEHLSDLKTLWSMGVYLSKGCPLQITWQAAKVQNSSKNVSVHLCLSVPHKITVRFNLSLGETSDGWGELTNVYNNISKAKLTAPKQYRVN